VTASPRDSGTFQNMLDWLETELRGVKSQITDGLEELEQTRAQVWDLVDKVQRADIAAANVTAQLKHLSQLPEEARLLRERIERVQSLLGQDQEQTELLARQLRAEIQADRDERGELRRRTEYAEQSTASVAEKLSVTEEIARRVQDDLALAQQRLEQLDVTLAGVDARIAANAEAQRRMQGDARNASSELERHDRILGDNDERLNRLQEAVRRLREEAQQTAEVREEFQALRERMEGLRQISDTVAERVGVMASDHEAQQARLAEIERALERQRTRADQQDRGLMEMRTLVEEAREQMSRDAERFLAFQEKVRRRQVADLEQEMREIKGQVRTQAANRSQPNA